MTDRGKVAGCGARGVTSDVRYIRARESLGGSLGGNRFKLLTVDRQK